MPCRDPLTLPENQQIDEMSVALLGDYCLVGDVKPQVRARAFTRSSAVRFHC